jgi:septation ring formation regulator EzrA
MTQTNIESLMLEQFSILHAKLHRIHDELDEVRFAAKGMGDHLRRVVLKDWANHAALASMSTRLDHVERRLELADGEPPKAAE